MRSRLWFLLALIWSIGAVVVALIFTANARRPADRPILKVSGVDSVIYYAVSRSLLFDGDVDLRNEFEVLKPDPGDWRAPVPATGLPAILFPIGFSLAQLPFLAVAAGLDWLAGRPVDGYSNTSLAAWYIGIVVWLCAGLTALFLWLRNIGEEWGIPEGRRDGLAFCATVVIWPATTLGYYTFSPMSHVAAFAATSLFLLVWTRSRDSLSVWRWTAVGAAAGLAALCRWQEVLLLILPLAWDTGQLGRLRASGVGGLKRWAAARTAGAVAFAVVLVPQLLEWRQVYGTWLTIPQGDGFVSFPPVFTLDVLFSSFNGWFTWTPITALGVAGLLVGLRRSPRLFGALLLTVVAEIVLVGGVLTWHGHWFGLRYLTSMVPLVAAGLFCLACSVRLRGSVVLGVVAASCALYTGLFAVQYRLDLIPKMSRLTADELVWDKLRMRRAYARRQRALDAAKALGQNDPRAALEIAERACVTLGANADLLDIRIAASQVLRDPAALASATFERERYQKAQVF
jgi:hypothetical protein